VAPKNSRGSRNSVQIYPDAQELEKLKARLRTFPPHDVTSIFTLPTSEANQEADRVTASVINGQLDELLKALGIDPTTPDAWRRGFQLLAMIHYRTGHFTYVNARQRKRGTSKSIIQQDRLLHELMNEHMRRGLKPTQALREIAKDSEKEKLLRLTPSSRLETSATELRYEALKKRWAKISKMAPPGSLLAALVGDYPVYGSEKDEASWRPNHSELPPLVSPGKSKSS
jgi:hypothetical protein